MATKLTDMAVKNLPLPPAGNRISYDTEVAGFGCRVTAAGARAFIVNYRTTGRERRITIGAFPDWNVKAAREEARAIKRRVDLGDDPMAERRTDLAAPTVDDLADRFVAEHLSKRRPATVTDYTSILRLYIRPKLGKMKVAELRHTDIDQLHREIAKTAPYRANRTVAVLSKMLALAVKWEMRTDNPARGIEREPEEKRDRFLSPAEISRLVTALAEHGERTSANAIKLLLLTGARKSEVLTATWDQFDLDAGVWTKPSAHTKQKKEHRVPLSAPALALLVEIWRHATVNCPYVFPGGNGKSHLTEIKRSWLAICRKAGLAVQAPATDASGKPILGGKGQPVMTWQSTVRIHDLRHSYASILASGGMSLPIIGRLLGHTQAQTTARYAHLMDDPLRAATERVGAIVDGSMGPAAEVVPMAKVWPK